MRSPRTLFSTSVALLVTAAPAVAAASPIFPDAIKADLSLTYDLGTTHCIICHANNNGGMGTVVQPFGLNMKGANLAEENTDSLKKALDALEAAHTDSDCNGVPDIEQLKGGQDPNTGEYIDGSGKTAMPSPGCGGTVAFGCGAQLSRVAGSWQGALALAAVLGAALARRRR